MREFKETRVEHQVTVLNLQTADGRRRAFDAAINSDLIVEGLVTFEPDAFNEPRTYIWVSRQDPFGDSYAMKQGGSIEEIADDEIITGIITKALAHMPLPGASPVRYINANGYVDPELN